MELYVFATGSTIGSGAGGGATDKDKEGKRVSVNKGSTEITGDSEDSVELTKRALLALDLDLTVLRDSVERISVQVYAMQRRHGVEPIEK